MLICRNKLINAILSAEHSEKIMLYQRLLEIWYSLLAQESINGSILAQFFFYGDTSWIEDKSDLIK